METPTPTPPPAAPAAPPTARTYLGWGATALLVISMLLPIESVPLAGTVTILGMGGVTVLLFVAAAILAGAAVYLKRYRLMAISGAVAVLLMLLQVLNYARVKHEALGGIENNPFGGFARGLMSLVHLEWGVAVVFAAGVALLIAAFVERDAATVPELVAANRRTFTIGGAGLVVLWVVTLLA